ncbi:hypothetical protein VB248_12205, partial [Arcicella rigui]|nr:hypothetical protein [Arcicella rigui]
MKTRLLLSFFLVFYVFIFSVKAQNIQKIEYFIDQDPGIGNATALVFTSSTSVTQNGISLPSFPASISDGVHLLGFRAKNINGWSATATQVFLKQSPPTASNIVSAEYFIDQDPGVGNATVFAISQNTQTITLPTNLSEGIHTLSVRFKDNLNRWSATTVSAFLSSSTTGIAPIVKVEYFIDNDPGFGNATDIPLASNSSFSFDKNNFPVDVPSNLTTGKHLLLLRAKDNNGKWSSVGIKEIEVFSEKVQIGTLASTFCNVSTFQVPYILEGAFVTGNVFNLLLSDANGDFTNAKNIGSIISRVNGTITANLPANVASGNYKIKILSTNPIRTSEAKNIALYFVTKPIITSQSQTICAGTSTVLNASGCSGGTILWTGNLTGSSVTVTPTKTSTYKALCTVNGCKSDSSTAVTITVTPKPVTPVAKSNNSSVCLGTSSVLSATGCAGTVSWTGNLTGSSVTVTPIKTTTYKALCTVNGCKSDSSTTVTITVTPKPATPVAKSNNSSVCLGTSSVLTATGCAGTVSWTGNLTGSSVTVTPSKTSTYKALCTVNGCKSDSSTTVTITVAPKPVTPVAKSNNSSVCLGTSSVLTATGCAGTVSWTGNLTGSSVT